MQAAPRRLTAITAASIAVLTLLAATTACGGSDDESGQSLLDIPETVAVGVLPDPLSGDATLPTPPPPPTTAPESTTTTRPPDEPIESPISAHVSGDRVLMVGDALLASAAPRNEELMCDALTLFGWLTEIDAESGHDLDFAGEVLDARLTPADGGDEGEDWDVVAFLIGSEIDGTDSDDLDAFEQTLESLLDRVQPRPTVLYTLPESDDGRDAINEIIRAMPEQHHNVLVIDFADVGGPAEEVVDDDGTTLTDDGNKRIAVLTAAALGQAPASRLGDCLESDYVGDDD